MTDYTVRRIELPLLYTVRQTRPDGTNVHYVNHTPHSHVFTSYVEEAVIFETKEHAEELRKLIENDTEGDSGLWVGELLEQKEPNG